MSYASDAAKWKAYQFSDPFAANSFYVCNKINKHFCRPNCEAYPVIELRSEVRFTDSPSHAIEQGYLPCESCDPTSQGGIDVGLLMQTVCDVNRSIGFTLPSLDDEEEPKDMMPRRQSVPSINEGPSSKNNSEHFRLVDLACRHLALAAAMSIMSPALPSTSNSPSSDEGSTPGAGKKKRKRRGGVLGFKELAAKSKLSAWHFHRVFKSVTGLTPKTYGDKCWEYLQDDKTTGSVKTKKMPQAPRGQVYMAGMNGSLPHSISAPSTLPHAHHQSIGYMPEYAAWSSGNSVPAQGSRTASSRLSESELDLSLSSRNASTVTSVRLPNSPRKRARSDEEDAPLPKRMAPPQAFTYATPTTATPLVDPTYSLDETDTLQLDFGTARAISDLDLANASLRPYSLFSQQPKQQAQMPQHFQPLQHHNHQLNNHNHLQQQQQQQQQLGNSFMSPQSATNSANMAAQPLGDDSIVTNSMMHPMSMADLSSGAGGMGSLMPHESQEVGFNDFSDLFALGNGLDIVSGGGLGAGLGDDLVDLQPDMNDFNSGLSSELLASNMGI